MKNDERSVKRTRRSFLAAICAAGTLAIAATRQTAPPPAPDSLRRVELIAGGRLPGVLKRPEATIRVLPLGSIEYHGPGAALGTDALLGAGLAERGCRRLHESGTTAILFPTVVYSQAPAHTLAFRGTISIRPEVVSMYLEDLLTGMAEMGFRRILVLNAHDGNIGPGRAAVSQVAHQRPEVHLLFLNWWETVPGPLVDSLHLFSQPNGGHGHGGPLELSAVAAINPAALIAERGPDLPAPPDISEGFPYYSAKSSATGWRGYSGNVNEASPEKGERIVGLATDRIVHLVKRWMAEPDTPGTW